MKKGQTSLEFIIIIAIILMISIFFTQIIFGTADQNKSIAKLKLKTIDIITAHNSPALLLKMDSQEIDSNLNVTLYIKDGSNLALEDTNYSDVILNIKETTNYSNINLDFIYN